MSVMLFNRGGIFKRMADCYESLKPPMRAYHYARFTEDDDYQFYTSLRRLYFANVATFLCQYHDDTPENLDIDPFQSLEGSVDISTSFASLVRTFIEDWNSLKYNLVTNDGERYRPMEAYEYIERLAASYMEAVVNKCAGEE